MEEDVGLVVAERAHRALAVVRVAEGERLEVAEAREVRDVLEIADEVGREVEVGERQIVVERVADEGDLVAREPQRRQLRERLEPLDPRQPVVVHPQRAQLLEVLQHVRVHLLDAVLAHVEVAQLHARLHPRHALEPAVGDRQPLQLHQPPEPHRARHRLQLDRELLQVDEVAEVLGAHRRVHEELEPLDVLALLEELVLEHARVAQLVVGDAVLAGPVEVR